MATVGKNILYDCLAVPQATVLGESSRTDRRAYAACSMLGSSTFIVEPGRGMRCPRTLEKVAIVESLQLLPIAEEGTCKHRNALNKVTMVIGNRS